MHQLSSSYYHPNTVSPRLLQGCFLQFCTLDQSNTGGKELDKIEKAVDSAGKFWKDSHCGNIVVLGNIVSNFRIGS